MSQNPFEIIAQERRNRERPGAERNRRIRGWGRDLLDDLINPSTYLNAGQEIGQTIGGFNLLENLIPEVRKIQIATGEQAYLGKKPKTKRQEKAKKRQVDNLTQVYVSEFGIEDSLARKMAEADIASGLLNTDEGGVPREPGLPGTAHVSMETVDWLPQDELPDWIPEQGFPESPDYPTPLEESQNDPRDIFGRLLNQMRGSPPPSQDTDSSDSTSTEAAEFGDVSGLEGMELFDALIARGDVPTVEIGGQVLSPEQVAAVLNNQSPITGAMNPQHIRTQQGYIPFEEVQNQVNTMLKERAVNPPQGVQSLPDIPEGPQAPAGDETEYQRMLREWGETGSTPASQGAGAMAPFLNLEESGVADIPMGALEDMDPAFIMGAYNDYVQSLQDKGDEESEEALKYIEDNNLSPEQVVAIILGESTNMYGGGQ